MQPPDRNLPVVIRGLSGRPLLDTTADARWFTDRESEVAGVLRAIGEEVNVLVLGERGGGKTSFLRRLAYLLRASRPSALDSISYCDGAGFTDPFELLVVVRERLTGPKEVLKGGLADLTIPAWFLTGTREEQWSRPGMLLRELDLFRARLDQDEGSSSGERRVVLLDSPGPAVVHALFGQLRDEVWSLPITWVVSGDVERRGILLEPPADAFFEFRLELSQMTELAARELLERRVGTGVLPEVLLEAIVAFAEGNPRRLITAARQAAASGSEWVEGGAEAARRFDEALSSLGRSASMLVAEMRARGAPVSASDPSLQARLGWTRARLAQVLQSLADAGLVVQSDDASGRPGRPRKLYELVALAGTQV